MKTLKRFLHIMLLVSLYFLVSNSLCDGGDPGDPGEPGDGPVVDSVIPARGPCRLLEVGCGSGAYISGACERTPELEALGLSGSHLSRLLREQTGQTFTDDGVVFTSAGNPVTLEKFDCVVVAEAMTPMRDAKKLLDRRKLDVHVIGDAKTPRNLMLAQSEAEEIARSL